MSKTPKESGSLRIGTLEGCLRTDGVGSVTQGLYFLDKAQPLGGQGEGAESPRPRTPSRLPQTREGMPQSGRGSESRLKRLLR